MRRGPSSATWTARSGSSRSGPPSSTDPTCRPAPTPSSPPPCANGSPSGPAPRCCPAIPVACSYGHGTDLPGTLSLTPELLAAVARQYAEWAAATSRPHPAAVRQRPLRQLRRARHRHRPSPPVPSRPAGRRRRLVVGEPEVAAEMTIDGDDVHAHRAETSVMLAVAPDLVHLDRLADGRRPRSHRRAGVPLHRPGPVDQRCHRPPVTRHHRSRRAAGRAWP